MRFMHNALSAIAGLMGCSSTTEYIDFGTSPVSNTLLFQVSILSMTAEQVCRCLEYNLNTGIVLCEDLGISDFSGSKSNYCRIPFSLLSVSSSEICKSGNTGKRRRKSMLRCYSDRPTLPLVL